MTLSVVFIAIFGSRIEKILFIKLFISWKKRSAGWIRVVGFYFRKFVKDWSNVSKTNRNMCSGVKEMVVKMINLHIYRYWSDIYHHKVVHYQMSRGEEMNTWIADDGKCFFLDNLRNWGELLLSGRQPSINVAGTEQFKQTSNCLFDLESPQENDSTEAEEEDSLENWFTRKRILKKCFWQDICLT